MDTHTTFKVHQKIYMPLIWLEYIAYTIIIMFININWLPSPMTSIFIEALAPPIPFLVGRRECGSLIDIGKFQVLDQLHKRNVKFIYTKYGYLVVRVGK